LFGLIRESVEQYKTEHHDFVVDALPDTLEARSEELVGQIGKVEREDKLLDELLRGVIKLRRVAAGENLNQLQILQDEAYKEGDVRSAFYQDLVIKNTRLINDLDQASRKISLKRLV
jgi:hypothetical protein